MTDFRVCTEPGTTPRSGLPDRRPYIRTEDASVREAEVAQLRARAITEARRLVPEWQPWMRQCLIATDWGIRMEVGEWLRRHPGEVTE